MNKSTRQLIAALGLKGGYCSQLAWLEDRQGNTLGFFQGKGRFEKIEEKLSEIIRKKAGLQTVKESLINTPEGNMTKQELTPQQRVSERIRLTQLKNTRPMAVRNTEIKKTHRKHSDQQQYGKITKRGLIKQLIQNTRAT